MRWRRLSVFFVLSVLVLSQVLALGTFFTDKLGIDSTVEQGYKRLLDEAEEMRMSLEAEIGSLNDYITNLENQIEGFSKDSLTLAEKAEKLQTQVNFWKSKSETLETSLVALQKEAEASSNLSGIATVDSEEKDKEIAELEKAPMSNRFAPILGAGATWDPNTGNFGATLDLGVKLNKFSLLVGAEYSPSVWTLEIPSLADLSFSAGGQVEF